MDFAIPSYKKKPTLAVEHVIAKKKDLLHVTIFKLPLPKDLFHSPCSQRYRDGSFFLKKRYSSITESASQ